MHHWRCVIFFFFSTASITHGPQTGSSICFTHEILITSATTYHVGCRFLKGKSMMNTLSIPTWPLSRWTHTIITLITRSLHITTAIILELQFIAPIETIHFSIEKELIRNTHSIHTSILIFIVTSIHLQQITMFFIHSRYALLHSITDLSPIKTQQSRITSHSLITNNITILLDFPRVLPSPSQLPFDCLIEGVAQHQPIFAILSEGAWMNALTQISIPLASTSLSKACILIHSFDARSPLMQDSTDIDILWLQFREAMESSTIVLTCGGVVLSNQIERLFWSTTIEERLKKNTIVEFHCESIFCFLKIDLVFHEDRRDQQKRDCSDWNHRLSWMRVEHASHVFLHSTSIKCVFHDMC